MEVMFNECKIYQGNNGYMVLCLDGNEILLTASQVCRLELDTLDDIDRDLLNAAYNSYF